MDGGGVSLYLLGIAVGLAACGHAGAKPPSNDRRAASEYCPMAAATLRSAVAAPERFDATANPPTAAPGVVFLRFDETSRTGRPFFVTIEQPGWANR